mgnify:CR=1 FL=1
MGRLGAGDSNAVAQGAKLLEEGIDRIRQGFWQYLPLGALLGFLMVAEMGLVLGSKYFQVPAADAVLPAGISNTKSIGALMFSDYVYPFELASIILLVGMIAAVLLTYRKRTQSKALDPSLQLAVKAQDRLRIVKMAAEKDEPVEPAQGN